MNCMAVKKFEDASHVGYNVDHVFDIKGHVKERSYVVKIDRTSHEFTCECLMFEFKGIICCHALCAMALEKISSIPSKYLLDRWSKKIKGRHSKIKCCYDGDQISPEKASVEEVLTLNGGSRVQLESSIEVAFGMDNNDRCGQESLDQVYGAGLGFFDGFGS
ncbi:hypothetical protein PIB30_008715 [Stylosanthes scabra]|uniref:Protein FAR1-RELATED SEQUENCE n=1 Tax=Stylosanthes scabra TaxID=79078 RepID=A0ABU6U6K3_9FABA|nr:hypothetical protein [Stylosanthes scabra]